MTDQHHQPRLQATVRVLTAVATGAALLALAGYGAHLVRLIALHPGWQGMSMLTAANVVFVSLSLWLRRSAQARPATALLCVATLATMSAVLCSHALHRADVISPWIAENLVGLSGTLSGRVSVATALCLLLLGVATLARARLAGGAAARVVVEVAANAALLVAGAALLGYAYRVTDLYGMYVFNSMSLQSALSIACLSLAILVDDPQTRLGMALRSPSLGVRQLRRMLLLTALPAVLGWLLLRLGGTLVQGNGAAMAVLVIATGVPMFYLLLENAHALDLLDRERNAQHDIERRLTADLQARVDAQTAALAEGHRREVASLAQTERTKRADMIAQLTGSIAHDFNNLLMVIGGSAQLLKLRMPGQSPLLPLVDKIASTVTGAARLTGQLSAFSRTQRLKTAPVHIDSTVLAALADVKAELPPAVNLVVDLDAGARTVTSDGVQLQLALVHLVRNAWEAIDGAGTVRVSTAIRHAGNGDDSVVVQVTDDGCGIPADGIGNALEPFFTTKHGKHHGLGLAQVNSVVQQASGTLHIASGPGRGTTVELVLPCLQEQAAAPVSFPAALAVLPRNERLLVIDDDAEVRAVIVALLQQMHYDVLEAGDGETGLRLLAQHEPALVIIDYLMPGMNGAEVARRARSHSPDLSIIFISGYSDSNAIAAIPQSQLLRKPVAADELARTVASVLHPA